jgi:hypothetical protein
MSNMSQSNTQVSRLVAMGVACALALAATVANAGPAEDRAKAKRMYDAIAGVPPTEQQLDTMQALVTQNKASEAALIATDDPAFYSVTLKNLATPWTNREQSVFADLNDYTATVIGMVRDDVPFNTALSADILYTVNDPSLPAVSAVNNDHYQKAEQNNVDLKAKLVATTQSGTYGLPVAASAGLMTTRAAAAAFLIDGTNRADFRFTMLNHMCHDMETVHDTTRPPDRIRQDVSRSPGGDSRIFLNNCSGCHSGMDPLAQSLAYYDFDETQQKLVYTPGVVNAKYFINSDNFKPGFITPDDSWENRWRAGPNTVLDWDTNRPATGNGASSMGAELANSGAFAECQVTKVFKTVCFRSPDSYDDHQKVKTITATFRGDNYNLRRVFADTAAACK